MHRVLQSHSRLVQKLPAGFVPLNHTTGSFAGSGSPRSALTGWTWQRTDQVHAIQSDHIDLTIRRTDIVKQLHGDKCQFQC